ncbi:ImmA/IrrE family metallo-endopeptidase [Rhizorhabdus wittichii]|uniref:ImmA/IrrE family metallo-endopeptidase n=1 Tax=Rhizorhabdus wittichii TaxID=160791 RepID=UPI00178C25C7|nr:ImmA/IrrE family metallo-endopeptidase [Rhizorhabdus wittichii]
MRAILRGDEAPMSELRAISTGLRIPLRILASGKRPSDDSERLGLLFRSVRQTHPNYDVTVERIATFVEAAVRVLPPADRLPLWLDDFVVRDETYEEAARLALLFRSIFCADRIDDPLHQLPQLLDHAGIVTARLRFSQYEGVSLVAENHCFIFVSPRFIGRMLFTFAHELGHIIAHHREGHAPIFERASHIGNFKKHTRSEGFVDAFASNLLLPDTAIARALQTIRDHFQIRSPVIGDLEILFVARYFGVSFDVAARRCEELELLPRGGAASLSDTLRKEYGSPEKRADMIGLPKRLPVRFPPVSEQLGKAVGQAINSGNISIGWAADHFGLSLGEILASHAPAGEL